MKKKIAITMGDPSGIGPEIVVASLNKMSNDQKKSLVIIGDINILIKASKFLKIDLKFHESLKNKKDLVSVIHVKTSVEKKLLLGKNNPESGDASFQYIVRAVDLALSKDIVAIVTAPISKFAMQSAGHLFNGHTDLLGKLTGVKDPFMFLTSKELSAIHVTDHLSLQNVPKKITKRRIEETIIIINDHLKQIGIKNPKIAVAGLNPHAGESNLFGDEETTKIIPAINNCKKIGCNVFGPFPADSLFHRTLKKEFDVIVAHYHDQGHVPIKLIAFDNAVNVTLGLPIIRTSVDHGTAFDIAWKGKADSINLNYAINYARKVLKN